MATITLPPPVITDNGDGSRTEVFYRVNDAGKKVKVTRRVATQLEEVSTPAERENWPKYGMATTEHIDVQKDEPVPSRLVPRSAVPSKDEDKGGKKVVRRVTCQYCRGEHLTYKCPLKDKIATSRDLQGEAEASHAMAHGMPPVNGMPPAGGKYVPPTARGAPPPSGMVPGAIPGNKYVSPGLAARTAGGPMGPGGPGGMPQRDESATLRVTNLPDNVRESDSIHNFSTIGRVLRCNVVKNKMTGSSRGFAFVEFDTPAQAERARQRFDGVAVGSMIMHVDFSEPRPK